MKRILIFLFFSFGLAKAQVNLLWAGTMGGQYSNTGYSITHDASGNVYTCGTFSGTADFDPGLGAFNLSTLKNCAFVSKLDAGGNFVWAKKFGGVTGSGAASVIVDGLGNICIIGNYSGTVDFDPGTGVYNLTSAGGMDVFLSKLDASGNFVLAKSIGGPGNDGGESLTIDQSDNCIMTGEFVGTADFDPGAAVFNLTSSGSADIFVCKLNAAGNFIWAKNMGGSSSWANAYSVVTDLSGNIYSTGAFSGTIDFDPGPGTNTLTSIGANRNIFINKLDASGSLVWVKSIGSNGINWNIGRSIAVDASGNVYTTGFFDGTADFDPGPGLYNITTTGGLQNTFICKLNTSGNFVWAKNFGSGTGGNEGTALTLDAQNNIYTTGFFTGTTDFDPGSATYNMTGHDNTFVSKLDTSGSFIWAVQLGGATSTDQGNSISVDLAGNIYVTGSFTGFADFDPGPGIWAVSTGPSTDIYVVKLNNPVGIVEENNSLNSLIIYPNPSNGLFNLQLINTIENAEIKVRDVLGQEIISEKLRSNKTEIDLSKCNAGIYFLNLLQGNKILTVQKLIKQ